MTASRLAVWGDPIAHSKSPALHAAAYAVLGLEWRYERRQVSAADFDANLAALDETWRGLSLTMPLKEAAFSVSTTRDRHAELTGAVNTLLLHDGTTGSGTARSRVAVAGYNTDVGGIVDALAEAEVTAPRTVRILGSGATAASALVAVAELGATRVDVRARRPERASALVQLGARLDVVVTVGMLDEAADAVDLTVATLPSGTVLDVETALRLADAGGVLFDAAYAPWPSALGAAWGSGQVISGLGMLLHQAVRQIRIFRHGDPAVALPDEPRVLAAMRAAL